MEEMIERVKLTSLFEEEKSVEMDAVIDTGATMVVLPNMVEELGLRKMREVKVRYANNKVETKPIIEPKGCTANLDVRRKLTVSYRQVLLDLIVELKTRKLIPNPASPEMPMMEILMTTAYNSGYAVCLRLPKPFATLSDSHTRKMLYAITSG